MNMRTGILIGLAVVLAGVTFFLAKMYLDSQREGYRKQAAAATQQKVIQTAEILVAKTNLPAGKRIKRENVEWRAWPKKGVVKTHFVKGDKKLDDILGHIVRRGIMAGEPIVKGRIVEQGDRGYMAALLDPGMRAVSIRVSKTTAVAGFIKPGDYVDVMLTISGAHLGGALKKRQVTETILRKIRVIAIASVTNDQATKPSAGKTITLQVTPKQAQIFTVGQRVGGMSLVLRSLTQEEFVATEESDQEMDSKSGKRGKGGKSGKKGAAGNSKIADKSKKDKSGKNANKGSPDGTDEGEEAGEAPEPIESLRTWDSEVSQVIVQMGGRRKKVKSVEIVRGNRSRHQLLIDLIQARNVGKQGKKVAKDTATGFQAGQRAAGTASSTLR